ncbi:hypothetical protein DPMN_180974 [Dreissena polymorpha]|uniref:Uncharacterized protein n=1 Tax=Dreissena polymorpha TaxID=45954 RepID=A0A9D4DDJ6_DREPO|nr:hypothetical protein DPMN_180974 [Dreissena polymorpha]
MNLICPISLLLLPFTYGRVCTDDHPSVAICETGSVHGADVSLEMALIGSYNASDCVCQMKANTSGFSINVTAGESVFGECGSRLEILFSDKSLQMNCGPSVVQSSIGDWANITVSNLGRPSAVHAQYCLTFFSDKQGTDLVLSCSAPSTPGQSSTPTTTPPPQSNTTSVQPQSTSNQASNHSLTLSQTTNSSGAVFTNVRKSQILDSAPVSDSDSDSALQNLIHET